MGGSGLFGFLECFSGRLTHFPGAADLAIEYE